MGEGVPTRDGEGRSQSFLDPAWGGRQLRRVSLFTSITDEELSELYRIGELRPISAKAHVVIEGESSRGLYILLQGSASVYKADPSTTSMVRLALLEEGEVFGELSLFDTAPRSATVVAETSCQVFHLDTPRFIDFLEQRGADLQIRFYKRCAEEMAERFRKQNEDYISAQKLLWQYALRRSND